MEIQKEQPWGRQIRLFPGNAPAFPRTWISREKKGINFHENKENSGCPFGLILPGSVLGSARGSSGTESPPDGRGMRSLGWEERIPAGSRIFGMVMPEAESELGPSGYDFGEGKRWEESLAGKGWEDSRWEWGSGNEGDWDPCGKRQDRGKNSLFLPLSLNSFLKWVRNFWK